MAARTKRTFAEQVALPQPSRLLRQPVHPLEPLFCIHGAASSSRRRRSRRRAPTATNTLRVSTANARALDVLLRRTEAHPYDLGARLDDADPLGLALVVGEVAEGRTLRPDDLGPGVALLEVGHNDSSTSGVEPSR